MIAWVSVAAMAFGTAALVLVLSVFNGFEGLVKTLYASFYPDLRISAENSRFLVLNEKQLAAIQNLKGVSAVSLVVQEKAHLQFGDYRANAILKGVDDSYAAVSGISNYIVAGKYATGDSLHPAAVLGVGLEQALNIQADRSLRPLTVYLPKRGVALSADPMTSLRIGQLNSSGTFAIQQEFDNNYVITHIDFLRQMIGLSPNEYSFVEIKLQSRTAEQEVLTSLRSILGNAYRVETRYEQNRSLFEVMRLEKWVIYAILMLLMLLASFNIVGSLTMLVLEKSTDIQILQSMGASQAFIRQLFLTEGLVLASIGAAAGTLLSFLLVWLQTTFKIIPLQGSFVIDYYPMKVMASDLLLVAASVIVIALLAAWVPSSRAARAGISLRGQAR
ncbi:MAG: ABC transporter permease [Chitinophagaceae bacterium]